MKTEPRALEARPQTPPRSSQAGRLLIRFGWLILLLALLVAGYYAWLLWGTGIQTSRAQHTLRQQITGRILHPQAEIPVSSNAEPRIPHVKLKDGEPVGILKIPRIHLDMVIVQGASRSDLTKGPGHYSNTPFPWDSGGKVAIAGHRTTYLHPFWSLDRLRAGDLIRIVTEFGTFDYRVTRQAVIAPDDTRVLFQTKRPSLILTTCTPRFSASHRLVVFADRSVAGYTTAAA